ncbi:uncharacterized protein [Hemitrygon akajei]|uniref:uncharacterized protein n=1 Tax=Hemitrygon akajei TaxID=2704970 RepID=UPI003BF9ED15
MLKQWFKVAGNEPNRGRAEPHVSYVEVNFKTPSAPLVRTDRDGVTSTYSELNFRKEETRIVEDEDPPISSGPGGLPTTAQTGAQKQEPGQNIGNRPDRKIYLLCLVTFALVAIVAGLSIYVSQIRQSKETCHRNYHELNSTLQSKLSALNSNLSDLKQMHSDLRQRFTEMETKYRSVNETKAQICELKRLKSRREQTCSKDWVTNKDRCYYVSTFHTSFRRAMQECSNRDSRLLEINSSDEASFASNKLLYRNLAHWIGKCESGNVSLALLYTESPGPSVCRDCEPHVRSYPCDSDRRFICEKSAPLFPDIPEEIKGLCQQQVEST